MPRPREGRRIAHRRRTMAADARAAEIDHLAVEPCPPRSGVEAKLAHAESRRAGVAAGARFEDVEERIFRTPEDCVGHGDRLRNCLFLAGRQLDPLHDGLADRLAAFPRLHALHNFGDAASPGFRSRVCTRIVES